MFTHVLSSCWPSFSPLMFAKSGHRGIAQGKRAECSQCHLVQGLDRSNFETLSQYLWRILENINTLKIADDTGDL